ncbi:HNH endonuclease signature motif containing protein [Myceligenerans xiligouense]|uniref:HNH nuclease domain-containing protein n=1 Tax=Myceligenerans xiligouense TaxID=253184 RepID=A0A3N4ZIF6_9MICO|nr:HNH endonuclease signature motif containing protein [Myceligenerans xiligouense]RPF19691.1 hypothetical protein EDD34_0254 [Myceligenerans xiligouense]
MHDGSRIARLVEMSRAGLERRQPVDAGQALDALADHVADLPDDVLSDMVRAAASLAGWAAGVQARAAGELVRRSEGFTGFEETTTMVSGELRETRRTARVITVRATAGLRHPAVIDHLSAGRIDAPRADALLLAGRSLTDRQRARAIEQLLPIAPERSATWLANEMRKLARTLDPGRESRSAGQSRAVFHDACEDEMGILTAFLPAVDSAAVWGVIDDLAQQMRRTDDTRTLGQLRADVLTSIVTGRLVPERRRPTEGERDDERDDERARWPVVRVTPTRPVVRVTVPLHALRTGGPSTDGPSTDTPVDETSGHADAAGVSGGGAAWLDGFGPVSAITAAEVAFDPDSTWNRLVTDPVTGVLTDYSTRAYRPPKPLADAVRLRDATCRGPGCQIDARWCDLDHIDSYEQSHAYAPGEPGQTRADNLHALCRTHHRLKTKYGWRVRRDPVSGITYWTAPTGRPYTKAATSTDPEPTSFRQFMRAKVAPPAEPEPDPTDEEIPDRGAPGSPHRHDEPSSHGKNRRLRGLPGDHPDADDEPPF